MSVAKRKRLFVDPTVQGAFLLRAVFYWLACVACLAMLLLTGYFLPYPDASFDSIVANQWFRVMPAVVLFLGLLPAMAFDMVRLTHRMVGPLVRLRSAMRGVAQGERISPLHFREDDFWRDCADEFNAILDRLHEAEAARQAVASLKAARKELAEATDRAE